MSWDVVWGLARAEARLTRRLARYWVFGVLAVLLIVVAYLYYALLHGLFSSYSASVGAINPRYLVAAFGSWGVMIFMLGLLFLGFDVRARDERERIVEVLDSQPCTNLELVAGRFLGILLMGWLPMAAAIVVVEGIGLLGRALEWPIGEPLEPWSIVGFLVTMAIPAFTFTLALVFLVSLLARNRLITALALIVVLVAYFWVFLTRIPIDVASAYDVTGAYTLNFASELVSVFTGRGLVQRAAVLVAGLGLLLLAAAVHPRPDGGQRRTWAAAGSVLLLAGLVTAGLVARQILEVRHRQGAWRAAHEAVRDAPAPDVTAVRGEVRIEPGRSLDLDLELDLEPPAGTALDQALFSLNPGLAVASVTDGAGRDVAFTHRDGLLAVALALAGGSRATLKVRASGVPDAGFAYLDGSRQWSDLSLMEGNVAILGYDSAIFDRRFVALMPDVRWLPAAGANVGRDDPRRPTDFYELDLTVDVPEGWLVAAPGRRREASGAAAGRARYRFAPGAPLPETVLVAAPYERRAVEIAGVELELLLAGGHAGNLEVFAEAGEEIRSWIEERLREAAELGLPYPYDGLTMVEVPATLRGFGGGWRMDTVMAPPGVLLLRESSLPTARFDVRFRDPKDFEDQEGGIVRAKVEVLTTFFENDFNGGNVFLGAARNFFLHQTSAQGPGALALDFVCHDLTNRLVTGQQGFFSAHLFGTSGDLNQAIGNAFTRFFSEPGGSFNEAMQTALTEQPKVWEQALGVALADMDPWEDPGRTVNVLLLKGGAMSRSLLDGLGRERAGALLAALRQRTAGRTFTRDDLVGVAAALEIDLGGVVGDWIDATELPGFVASQPRLYRLPEAADGTPRYQLALTLRNDEAAPGLARLRYVPAGEEEAGGPRNRSRWQESEPLRVGPGEAVEIGLVLSKPVKELRVAPYLALNRGEFTVPLPALDEQKTVDVEPFTGVRPSDWQAADAAAIVVDDLDPGFAVEQDEARTGLRLGARGAEATLDGGLPVGNLFQPPREWSRLGLSEAWGKYRHTLAFVRAGTGNQRAVFAAELPRPGPWRLELHMPPESARRRWKLGTFNVTVHDGADSHELRFAADGAEEGWNLLGELEMPAGEARVTVSDESDGRVVLADAIRWRPLGTAAASEDASAEAKEGTDGD
jgi:ABC-type transport system involved in multi-copper enzyme maturation permease subunit